MRETNLLDQIKNLRHSQQLLAIAALFLVVTIGWIFLGIFTGQQNSKISPLQKKAAAPLTPQIDEEVLKEIEGKRVYTDAELSNFPIYKVISVNRGKEKTIVPITFDENDLEEKSQPSVTLETITQTNPTETSTQSSETSSQENQESTDPTPPPVNPSDTPQTESPEPQVP